MMILRKGSMISSHPCAQTGEFPPRFESVAFHAMQPYSSTALAAGANLRCLMK